MTVADRIDPQPQPPTPAHPEPSYTRVVLIRTAEHLALLAPDTQVTDRRLQRALKVAVAQELADLDTTVADDAKAKAVSVLPPLTTDTRVGAYVGQLRETARGL
jgi:hypothetical protein